MAQQGGRRPAKYRQIAADLHARIQRGEWPVDAQMPTLPELATEYRAAPGTIDKALAELRKLGIAETIQGMGTFVREPRESGPSPEYLRLAEQIKRLSERMDAAEAWIAEQEGRGEQ